MSDQTTSKRPHYIAYTVTEHGERSYFNRVGVAWRTKKAGVKVVLEAFPVNGEVLLLPPRDDEK